MTIFRNFLTVFSLALFFTLTLGSCKKDGTELPTPNTTENTNTGDEGTSTRSMEGDMDEMDELCFEFVYPISVVLPDGDVQTANDDDELEAIFEDYYMNNPTSMEDPMLQFPVDVVDEEGVQSTLADEEALFELLDMCFDDEEWEECFSINYPVTVVFPDGDSQVVNDDEELEAAFEDWYDANPTSNEDPTLEFPIEVTDEDGNVISVADEDELEELFDECYDDEWDDEDYELCFDIVFPVTIEFPDGSTADANDYDELDELYFEWFENNPTATEFPTLAFPIQVELEDGEIVDVNSEEELEELFEACEDEDDDWSECFTFNYPITILFPDGTSADVNSDDELETVVEAWFDANPTSMEEPTLQFPVDVTTDDGDVVTLNSEEELEELLEDCWGCLIVNGGEIVMKTEESVVATQIMKQHSKVQSAKRGKVANAFRKK